MSDKTLLVLAASYNQVPIIKTAKRLGYRTITTDNVPSNPGHALADTSYSVDTTDKEAVLNIAYREKIDGIIAACTDVAVPTAGYVAGHLGLPGPPDKCASTVCDKEAFRNFQRQHELPAPDFYPVTAGFRPSSVLFEKSNWIIKPDRSSGSKGVFILKSAADFRQRLPETLAFCPTGKGILERYIHGFQGTCAGILKNGELALACVLDRQVASPPYVATLGHRLPSKLPKQWQSKLFAELKNIWRLLGVADGVFDCDFVAADDTVYILELSPRLGGNSIPDLLSLALGFDIVEFAVKKACSDPASVPKSSTIRPSAVVLLGVMERGHLSYNQEEVESLQKEPWVDSLSIPTSAGEPVAPFIDSRYSVGAATILGRDRNDVDARVAELKRRLNLRTE